MFNYIQSITDIEKNTGLTLNKVYACDGIMILHKFNMTKIKNIDDKEINEFESFTVDEIKDLPDYYFKNKHIIIEVK